MPRGSRALLRRPLRPHEPDKEMRTTSKGKTSAILKARPHCTSTQLAEATRGFLLPALLLLAGALPALGQQGGQEVGRFKVVAESASTQATSDVPVFLTDRVGENLSHVYRNVEHELPLCLFGTESRKRIVVRRVGLPRIDSATDSTAEFSGRGCQARSGFLGYVHNHSKSSPCRPSLTDTRRFLLDKEPRIELVACPRPTTTIYHALVKNSTYSARR